MTLNVLTTIIPVPQDDQIKPRNGPVGVNQCALVRKILARYSYEFALFRELLQNADDARSNEVVIRFETAESDNNAVMVKCCSFENTGNSFTKEDWDRLSEIAHGNPYSGKVGAFGVGFYSVFSVTNSPAVFSDGWQMGFDWQDEQGPLRFELSEHPESTGKKGATIKIPLKEPAEMPDINNFFQFLATSITFMACLKNVQVFQNTDCIGCISKSEKNVGGSIALPITMQPVSPSTMRFLEPIKLQRSQFTIEYFPCPSTENQPNVSCKLGLNMFSLEAGVELEGKLSKELSRCIKEQASRVEYRLIYTGKEDYDKSSTDTKHSMIYRELRADLNEALHSKIFIGHSTRQTTGVGGHMESQFIPTVERESIDLVERNIAVWNNSLLYLGSFLSRVVYELELDDIQIAWDKLGESRASKTPSFKPLHERFIHVLKFFTVRPSTPSPKVAEKLRESFYTCSTAPLRLLSSAGVREVSDIRLHDSLCEKFLKDVPMLPLDFNDLAAEFVKAQPSRQEIQRLNLSDVKHDLEKHALNRSNGELVTCLRWILREWGAMRANDLLGVARFQDGDTIVPLSSIRHFINHGRDGAHIPLDGPLPRSVLPHQITRSIAPAELEKCGWREFTVVDWLRHISSQAVRSDNDGKHDFIKSSGWAELVLRCVSSIWTSGGDIRKLAEDVLANESCIPTTRGLRIPKESCLPNSNTTVFNDVDFPMVQLPSGREITGEMAQLLTDLGVKKHPPLRLVLKQVKMETSSLIDYLVCMFSSLSDTEIEDLKSDSIFAKKGNRKNDSEKRFRVNQLYPPTEDFQKLGLPLIDWGGRLEWQDPSRKEVKMLYRIGLNRFPPLEEIIKLTRDSKFGKAAFEYLYNNLQTRYSDVSFEDFKQTAFIPMENMDGLGPGKPEEMFLDRRWKLFYLPVIQSEYQECKLEDLGVRRHPPSTLILQQLEKLAEGSLSRKPIDARKLFQILSEHVSRFQRTELDRISLLRIVSYSDHEGKEMMLAPVECYLGQSTERDLYQKLFHFINLEDGEKFLYACGAKREPTREDVAKRLSNDPEQFYNLTGRSSERFLQELRLLASEHNSISNATIGKMKTLPVLLGKINRPECDYVLKKPKEIVIVDDERTFQLFSDSIVTAPRNMSPELEEFYKLLGCQLLTTVIKDEPNQSGSKIDDQTMCDEYRDLVLKRLPIFLHNYPLPEPGTPAARFSGAQDLTVRIWEELSVSKILTVAKNATTKNKKVSATTIYKENTIQLWLTYGIKEDIHDLAVSLCRAFLGTENPPDIEFLTTCLSEDLDVLERRGYEIDRDSPRFNDWGLFRPAHSSTNIAQTTSIANATDSTGQLCMTEGDSTSGKTQSTTNRSSLGGTERTPRSCTASPVSFPSGGFEATASGKEETSCEVRARKNPSTPILCQSPDLVVHQKHIESTIGAAIQASSGSGINRTPLIRPTDPKVKQFLNSYCGISALVDDLRPFCRVGDVAVYVTKDFPSVNTNSTWVPKPLSCFLNIIQRIASVYGLSTKSFCIFYHATAGCIAFNRNGIIYLNLQYFEKWHYKDVSEGKQRRALSLWFLTFAHEIAHNLVSGHDSEHEFWFLAICEKYMDKFSQHLVSV